VSLNKLLSPVITALLIAFILGGLDIRSTQAEMKALQTSMDKRLERIERRIDSQPQMLGYLDAQ
jgi:uncharacterized membrane-anchored protein YhcB (DUF1043 family)